MTGQQVQDVARVQVPHPDHCIDQRDPVRVVTDTPTDDARLKAVLPVPPPSVALGS